MLHNNIYEWTIEKHSLDLCPSGPSFEKNIFIVIFVGAERNGKPCKNNNPEKGGKI